MIIMDKFAYFLIKTCAVGTQNRLAEAILMSIHNIGFFMKNKNTNNNCHQTLLRIVCLEIIEHTITSRL